MPDTLLAVVPRSRLSAILTAFHRDGYGFVTRVLDPDRAPLARQLGRAGIQQCRLATSTTPDTVVLFVGAPGRATAAAALAVTHGALDVELVTCGTPVSAAVAPGLISVAGDRREKRSDRRAPSPVAAVNPPVANEPATS